MKRTKNINKNIFVKRIWVDKEEYDYIKIPLAQFLDVQKNAELSKRNNKPMLMILKKAPFWYSSFRYVKSNFIQAIFFIVGVIVTLLIGLLWKHFVK